MATFGTSNKYIVYSLNSQELQIDIDNNRSLVRVWVDAWRTNTGYTTYGSGTVYCGINGTVYTAGITSSQKITSSAIRLGTWDVWIPHDGDGSKTIWVSARIDHSQFTASDQGYNHTLSTIPRASDASISYSGYIGDNLTVNISRKSSSFTHSVYHDFVAGTWTLVASNVDTSYTFQTPLEWLNRIPNSVGSAGRILVRTWNGGSIVGDKIYNFNANAKNTVVPTFTSVTASAVNPFGSLYLQGKSSIKLTINGASGVYGSTIKTYSISGGDYSYSGDKNTYTTGVVDKSGDITFTATITDSRGRTASKTVKVTVTAYTLPTLTFETYRCDSSGTKDIIKGTYIYVKPTFTYCVITGNAIKTKSIKINNTSKSTAFNSGQGYVFGTYPLRSTHEVEVSITDNVGNTVSVTHEIGIGKVILNIPPHKNGVGWGRYCDKEEEFQIGYDLNVFGRFLINGVKQPVFKSNDNYTSPVKPIEKKDIYFKYSSAEQWTGEYWEDGKKIYTKVLFPIVPANGEVNYSHGVSNIGDYRTFDYSNSYFQNKSTKQSFPISVYVGSTAWCFPYSITDSQVQVRFGSDFVSGWKLVVTIKYTKTTD